MITKTSLAYVFWACVLISSVPLYAQDLSTNESVAINLQQDSEQFHQAFQSLLLSDDYSTTQTQKKWQSQNKPFKPNIDTPTPNWDLRFLANVGQVLGVFGKVVLLLLLAALLYWLYCHKDRVALFVQTYLPSYKTTVMPHFEHKSSALFADLPEHHELYAAISHLLTQGHYIQALSWLYQGSLRVMSLSYQLPITHSQTEEQCQALLAKSLQASNDEQVFFRQLIAIWQEAAYGKRLPANPKSRLGVLLEAWGRLYYQTKQQGGSRG